MDHRYPAIPSLAELGVNVVKAANGRPSGKDLPKPKKFRFQLLFEFIERNFERCRVADIGGGKGLMTYLLRRRGWDAVVIDPHEQALPAKYKDIATGQRRRIGADEAVPRINEPFEPAMAAEFDLLVGMHAHGCNIKIIEAASKHGAAYLLLPCCVIDEPAIPTKNVHWLKWLGDYAADAGMSPRYFQLNFKGQNIGFFSDPEAR